MKLIDTDTLTEELWKPEYRTQTRRDFITAIGISPSIDPVHIADGCYCRECFHSELEEHEYVDDWKFKREWWCNKHKDTMPLNGFCSEGRKDDMKNG